MAMWTVEKTTFIRALNKYITVTSYIPKRPILKRQRYTENSSTTEVTEQVTQKAPNEADNGDPNAVREVSLSTGPPQPASQSPEKHNNTKQLTPKPTEVSEARVKHIGALNEGISVVDKPTVNPIGLLNKTTGERSELSRSAVVSNSPPTGALQKVIEKPTTRIILKRNQFVGEPNDSSATNTTQQSRVIVDKLRIESASPKIGEQCVPLREKPTSEESESSENVTRVLSELSKSPTTPTRRVIRKSIVSPPNKDLSISTDPSRSASQRVSVVQNLTIQVFTPPQNDAVPKPVDVPTPPKNNGLKSRIILARSKPPDDNICAQNKVDVSAELPMSAAVPKRRLVDVKPTINEPELSENVIDVQSEPSSSAADTISVNTQNKVAVTVQNQQLGQNRSDKLRSVSVPQRLPVVEKPPQDVIAVPNKPSRKLKRLDVSPPLTNNEAKSRTVPKRGHIAYKPIIKRSKPPDGVSSKLPMSAEAPKRLPVAVKPTIKRSKPPDGVSSELLMSATAPKRLPVAVKPTINGSKLSEVPTELSRSAVIEQPPRNDLNAVQNKRSKAKPVSKWAKVSRSPKNDIRVQNDELKNRTATKTEHVGYKSTFERSLPPDGQNKVGVPSELPVRKRRLVAERAAIEMSQPPRNDFSAVSKRVKVSRSPKNDICVQVQNNKAKSRTVPKTGTFERSQAPEGQNKVQNDFGAVQNKRSRAGVVSKCIKVSRSSKSRTVPKTSHVAYKRTFERSQPPDDNICGRKKVGVQISRLPQNDFSGQNKLSRITPLSKCVKVSRSDEDNSKAVPKTGHVAYKSTFERSQSPDDNVCVSPEPSTSTAVPKKRLVSEPLENKIGGVPRSRKVTKSKRVVDKSPIKTIEAEVSTKRSPEGMKRRISDYSKEYIMCPERECFYITTYPQRLRLHLLTHSGERKFPCSECEYKATQRSSLMTHVYLKHTTPKLLSCAKCSYKTALKGNLKKHISIHSREKAYKCEKCNFGAHQKHSLDLHIELKHGKPNLLKCGECMYQTALKWNLKKHKLIHLKGSRCRCHCHRGQPSRLQNGTRRASV